MTGSTIECIEDLHRARYGLPPRACENRNASSSGLYVSSDMVAPGVRRRPFKAEVRPAEKKFRLEKSGQPLWGLVQYAS